MKKRIVQIGCLIAVLIIAAFAISNLETTRLASMVTESRTQEEIDDTTVYYTKTGNCYHVSGCSCLRSSCFETTYGQAVAWGLEPCSRCNAYYWVNY